MNSHDSTSAHQHRGRKIGKTLALIMSVVLLTDCSKTFAGPLDEFNKIKKGQTPTIRIPTPNLPKPPKAIEQPLYDLGKKIDKTISGSKHIPHKPSDVITQPLVNGLNTIPKPKPNVSTLSNTGKPNKPSNSDKPTPKPSKEPGNIVDDKPQTKKIKPSNDPGNIVDDKPQSKPIKPQPNNNNIPQVQPNFPPVQPNFPPVQPNFPPVQPNFPPVQPNFPPVSPPVIPVLPPNGGGGSFEPEVEQPQEWETRELVIHNDTKETIEVYVRYYTINDEDKWEWFPNEPGDDAEWAGPFLFEPGEKSTLQDGDFVIDASKCQIKATSKDSNAKWGTFNVTMVKKPYVAQDMESFTFRLYLND